MLSRSCASHVPYRTRAVINRSSFKSESFQTIAYIIHRKKSFAIMLYTYFISLSQHLHYFYSFSLLSTGNYPLTSEMKSHLILLMRKYFNCHVLNHLCVCVRVCVYVCLKKLRVKDIFMIANLQSHSYPPVSF